MSINTKNQIEIKKLELQKLELQHVIETKRLELKQGTNNNTRKSDKANDNNNKTLKHQTYAEFRKKNEPKEEKKTPFKAEPTKKDNTNKTNAPKQDNKPFLEAELGKRANNTKNYETKHEKKASLEVEPKKNVHTLTNSPKQDKKAPFTPTKNDNNNKNNKPKQEKIPSLEVNNTKTNESTQEKRVFLEGEPKKKVKTNAKTLLEVRSKIKDNNTRNNQPKQFRKSIETRITPHSALNSTNSNHKKVRTMKGFGLIQFNSKNSVIKRTNDKTVARKIFNSSRNTKTKSTTKLNLEQKLSNKSELRYIIIDGSNIAREHGKAKHGNNNVFSCDGIKIAVDFFKTRGHNEIKVIIPRFRRGTADKKCPSLNPQILDDLEKQNHITYTPSKFIEGKLVSSHDDKLILEAATAKNAVVVSNDHFRDLLKDKPEWKDTITKK
jgi:hypothetical protein